MVAWFMQMQDFLSTTPSLDDRIKWTHAYPIPNRKRSESSESKKPKVEITFNGLSQKELQAQFPLPIVLDPSLRAVLTFVIANVGNGPALDTYVLVATIPPDVRVDHRGAFFYEKPNHNRYQMKAGRLVPKEISGTDYEFTAEVKVPEAIDAFNVVLRIYGDNLPHEDLVLNFRAIHYKRPEGS